MEGQEKNNGGSSLPETLVSGLAEKFGDKLEVIDTGSEEKTPEELAAEAQELGGTDFDDDGNLLDESGEILKTKEDLEKEKSSKKGNDNDDDDENEDELSFTESLLQDLEVEEEELEGIDLKSNDSETIKKVIEIRENKVKEKALRELFETDSEIEEFVKHKAQGLSLDSFKQKKQAEEFNVNFELDEENSKQHEEIVRVSYESKGIKGKKLDAIVEALKDDDELFTEAKSIVDEQKQIVLKNANAKIEAEKKQRAEALLEQQNAIKEVETVLDKKILDGRVKLTPDTAQQLKKFALSEERDKKWSKLTTEQMLLIDYLVMTDFNVKGLEKATYKTPLPKSNSKKVIIGGKTKGEEDVQQMSYEELMKNLKRNTQN